MRHTVPLPETWEVATIDEVTSYVQRGKSPAYTEKSDLPVVNQKCIRWNGVDPQWLKFVHPDQWPQWGEERFLQPGDVLWNSTGTGTIGRAALFRGLAGYGRAVVDSHVTILRTGVYSPALLHYWIMSPAVQAKIDRMQAGSTNQVELSRAEVLATQVVMPPLPEQQRIVEAIESYLTRLDNAVALLERVEENLKRYRASVLKAAIEGRLVPTEAELARREGREYEPASELLKRILAERKTRWIEDAAERARAKAEEKARKAGQHWAAKDSATALEKERAKAAKQYKEPAAPDTSDLPELPEGWCWTSIGECFDVCIGATPSRGVAGYWSGGIPWVSSGEVAFCRIKATRETISQEGLTHTSTQLNPAGTVLVGMIGEGKTRGQVAILDIPACNNQNAAAIHVSATDSVPEYIYHYLSSQYEQTRRLGSGGNQPALNKARVQAIRLPLPPREEQGRIVNGIECALGAADKVAVDIARDVDRSARLRQSILKWAFEGRLVEQDPNDEPALALLERIRAERAAAGAPKVRGRKKETAE